VRQWVISVTELSLDLSPDKWQKSGWSLHCFRKSGLWFRQDNESKICEKTFCTLWLSAELVVTFLSKFCSNHLSIPRAATLDWTQGALNLGPSVYGLKNHGMPAWSVCTSWGIVSQKSLFVSFLSFSGQQEDVEEVHWCTGKKIKFSTSERKVVGNTILWRHPPPWFDISAQQTRRGGGVSFWWKAGWLVYRTMTCVALIRDIDIDVVLRINTDIEYFIRDIKVDTHLFWDLKIKIFVIFWSLMGINKLLFWEKKQRTTAISKGRTSIMLNVERKAFWPSSLFCDDNLKTTSASLLDNHTN
jgi:hypothetical protein